MTQAERDRLAALKKAKKKLITQKQAAEEIGSTERQVQAARPRIQSEVAGQPWVTAEGRMIR